MHSASISIHCPPINRIQLVEFSGLPAPFTQYTSLIVRMLFLILRRQNVSIPSTCVVMYATFTSGAVASVGSIRDVDRRFCMDYYDSRVLCHMDVDIILDWYLHTSRRYRWIRFICMSRNMYVVPLDDDDNESWHTAISISKVY